MPLSEPPATTGIHHFSPTVSDVEKSSEWYCRVFGLERLPRLAPHHADEEGGYAVLLVDQRSGLLIGLHHHEASLPETFDERRVGLDHIAWGVEKRTGLEAWGTWLDHLGIEHSGIIDKTGTSTYAAIVFRDPDNIQLELFHRG